ncbi:hypothetical protein ALP58_200137 [Pseudomonas savastanoi]|uniref:Nucleoside 2-deoxyribosyltransferase n=2 Tax=Pseudomonas syringae group TaxID=136849 RepID=A0A0P9MZL3_PSESX|nr:hypothetical protein ALO79_200325 [Pseudomonas syringae pv. castaneae]RMS85996.1 hypothetical protein ALP58_200137 [Pseudomonas savastanoi]
MQTPLVYLAGFDVFRPDAVEYGRYLKALCSAHGLEGLYPFDNEVRGPGSNGTANRLKVVAIRFSQNLGSGEQWNREVS